MILFESLFWFLFAFFFAALEVEIEAKHGWAEKLPTWYRTTGVIPRIFAILNGGNPLTGYHLFLSPLVFMIFHVGYFVGIPWSIKSELLTLSTFFAWVVMWDFLWFVLNPAYGVKNFKKDNIWWHAKCPWFFNVVPYTYVYAVVVSLVLAILGALLSMSTWSVLFDQLTILFLFFIFIFVTIFFAPLYHSWYLKMREFDERDKSGIR